MLTYKIDQNNVITIFKDGVATDVHTAWDSQEGAKQWAQSICDKYNDDPSLEYPPQPIDLNAETV